MDTKEYRLKMSQRALELILTRDRYDPDVWNLEYMITQIQPHSPNWRGGCIRSLRRAIEALKEEKNNAE